MRSRLPSITSMVATLALTMSIVAWPGSPAVALASFSDGFESGSLSAWTQSAGMSVQTTDVHSGSFATRSTTSIAWASKTLPDTTDAVEVSMWFRFASRQSPVWLARARTGSNVNLVKFLVNNAGRLAYRNDVAGLTRTSTVTVSTGVWHRLVATVEVAGANGHVSVSLDGSPVAGLDRVESMGTTPIGKLEVGNRPTGKTYDLRIDDVVATDLATAGDLQPPTGLTVESAGASGVDLSWTPPASGPAPSGYLIYRDNALVGTVPAPSTSFTDAAATGVTRYLYRVTSLDGSTASLPTAFVVAESTAFGSNDAVVYASGDIVCKPNSAVTTNTCRHGQTADIVDGGAADAVIALGDLQYEIGRPSEYSNAYHPTWGRVKSITLPVVGNHEYMCKTVTQGCSYPADGYYGYFGAAAGDPDEGWYREEIAGWTVLSLNSNCNAATPNKDFTDCNMGSPQYQWLQQQLATDGQCTIAAWHHPRFSSGDEHGSTPYMQDMWTLLANNGVDLLLVGHEHIYERFAPANAAGAAANPGLRQFTVGTGGRDRSTATAPHLGLSQAISDDAFGVLKLTLHNGGYDYAFVPAWGDSYADAGTGACA